MDGWLLSQDSKTFFMPISAATTVEGVPRQRMAKEIIKKGQFHKQSTGQNFKVDDELLDNWVTQFKSMKEHGIEVPIPNMHKNAGNPKENMGYVTELVRSGDSLYMTCDIIGEKAIEAAAKSDVSIHAIPKISITGKSFDRPIQNVAMCTDPVVNGLGGFFPIAASYEKENGTMTPEQRAEIVKTLGITEEVTDENFSGLCLSAIATRDKSAIDKLAIAEAAQKAVEQKLVEIKASSSDEKPKPDATVVDLAKDNIGLMLSGLVKDSKITPAVKDKLAAEFATEEGISLSITTGTLPRVKNLLMILGTNNPVELAKSHSGPQAVLSKGNLDADDNELEADAEARAKEFASA